MWECVHTAMLQPAISVSSLIKLAICEITKNNQQDGCFMCALLSVCMWYSLVCVSVLVYVDSLGPYLAFLLSFWGLISLTGTKAQSLNSGPTFLGWWIPYRFTMWIKLWLVDIVVMLMYKNMNYNEWMSVLSPYMGRNSNVCVCALCLHTVLLFVCMFTGGTTMFMCNFFSNQKPQFTHWDVSSMAVCCKI